MAAAPCLAETSESDSLRTYAIGEIVIASDPKTTGSLSEQPFSYSELKADDMAQLGIRTVKERRLKLFKRLGAHSSFRCFLGN